MLFMVFSIHRERCICLVYITNINGSSVRDLRGVKRFDVRDAELYDCLRTARHIGVSLFGRNNGACGIFYINLEVNYTTPIMGFQPTAHIHLPLIVGYGSCFDVTTVTRNLGDF